MIVIACYVNVAFVDEMLACPYDFFVVVSSTKVFDYLVDVSTIGGVAELPVIKEHFLFNWSKLADHLCHDIATN